MERWEETWVAWEWKLEVEGLRRHVPTPQPHFIPDEYMVGFHPMPWWGHQAFVPASSSRSG